MWREVRVHAASDASRDTLHAYYIPRLREGLRCPPLPNPGGRSVPLLSPLDRSIPTTTSMPSDNPSDNISVAKPSEIPVWTCIDSNSPDGSCFQMVRLIEVAPLPAPAASSAPFPLAGLPPSVERSAGLAVGGVNRNAAFGILSTASRCATTIETLAVIPGFRRRS